MDVSNPLPLDNEKLPYASNPVLWPRLFIFIKISVFLVNFTVQNKEFFNFLNLCQHDAATNLSNKQYNYSPLFNE